MVKSLYIQNYALIQELKMTPSPGLNIITGETGAGKSIMLGAVGLLLGNRADTKVLFNELEKCIIEGTFEIDAYNLQSFFEDENLDYSPESVIRRELANSGKSRAFINDTPVTLNVLKSLGTHLMDIHSQHESLQLGSNRYQMNVLDAFASHRDILRHYRKRYAEYTIAKEKLQKLEKLAAENAQEADYKQFSLEELVQIGLDDLNQKELEEELGQLENAENIKLNISQSTHVLDESEVSVLRQLKEIQSRLNSIRTFGKSLDEVSNRMESTSIELADLASELNSIQERTGHDPERIMQIKDRLDSLYRVQKKHQVTEVSELITLRDELESQLTKAQNLDTQIEEARNVLVSTENEMINSGSILSDSRKLYALNFSDEIEKIIRKIGIENGQIEIRIEAKDPSANGLDQVEILFSANKGVQPQPLKSVASGGEFSRLIFTIKYLIADKTALPTIIFDEIDTGVSGEVALQMIGMLKQMATNHQVISISHLPQFAAGGDKHYFVYKDHESDQSVSKIRALEGEARVTEIAKMIGGSNPGNSTIQSAKDLIDTS